MERGRVVVRVQAVGLKPMWEVGATSSSEGRFEIDIVTRGVRAVTCEVGRVEARLEGGVLDVSVLLLAELGRGALRELLRWVEELASGLGPARAVRLSVVAGRVPEDLLGELGYRRAGLAYLKEAGGSAK